jgi:secreted PhoX family phosphatase
MSNIDRRKFLRFLGTGTVALSNMGLISSLTSCTELELKPLTYKYMSPTFEDNLVLAQGLKYKTIISWGDKINSLETFGFNCDYITIEPISSTELLMWVNHEYANYLWVSGKERTKANIDKERRAVGGSIISVIKVGDDWKLNPTSKLNKGVRADTPIPFNGDVKVRGTNITEGTLGNCAGGKTPWGTFLTCEENYHINYGERNLITQSITPSIYGWEKIYNNPPEHYGWVVEIDPKTAQAKKHVTIGRYAHECATCVMGDNEKVVVYSADDKNDEHLYKFISNAKDNLDSGKLYVADIENGKWISLDMEDSPILKKHFKNQLEIQIYTRKASKILKATPLARPEDIEIHPKTKDVYITLTNNKPKGNFHGSILKLSEKNSDHSSLEFKSENYLLGGEEAKFSCPDNLAFDKNGNLWMVSDISGSSIGKAPYEKFANNGLFVIPTSGVDAGKVLQVGSAPVDAELTGLCFSPDYKSLFLSVQHPGELSQSRDNPTSKWPTGSIPKPSVVEIKGPLLETFTLANA